MYSDTISTKVNPYSSLPHQTAAAPRIEPYRVVPLAVPWDLISRSQMKLSGAEERTILDSLAKVRGPRLPAEGDAKQLRAARYHSRNEVDTCLYHFLNSNTKK